MYWPLVDGARLRCWRPRRSPVHVTLAAPPLASVAENCSTAVPDELVALQPVQLVSIVAVPGEIENVPFEELAATPPPPHPASKRTVPESPRMRRSSTRPIRLPCQTDRYADRAATGACSSASAAFPPLNCAVALQTLLAQFPSNFRWCLSCC